VLLAGVVGVEAAEGSAADAVDLALAAEAPRGGVLQGVSTG
jgi:hypothetical protein